MLIEIIKELNLLDNHFDYYDKEKVLEMIEKEGDHNEELYNGMR